MNRELRVAVLQRVCPSYRAHLFNALSREPGIRLRLFIGSDLPNSKVKSGDNLGKLDVVRLPTRFISFFGRTLVHHRNLFSSLRAFRPDVIVCEGESNFLSYLCALVYRMFNPDVAAIHWSLGGIPGGRKRSVLRPFLTFLRRRFDAFLVYSTFGKGVLIESGLPADRIFVAVNVSDLRQHLDAASKISREDARARLGFTDQFVALYVGAMTPAKRLPVLLDAAQMVDPRSHVFLLAGDGDVRASLESTIRDRSLRHVQLLGKITHNLADYYRAADVMVLPGRGGMVISEAMAYGLPVIAYQADGTEYDLIDDRKSGVILKVGTAAELVSEMRALKDAPTLGHDMGVAAQNRVQTEFTPESMVEAIVSAIRYAAAVRAKL